MSSRTPRSAGLLVAASLCALMLGAPSRAQAPSQVETPLRVLTPGQPTPDFTVGRRIDRSQLRDAAVEPNTEREDPIFAGLTGSSVISVQTRLIAPAAPDQPPMRAVTVQDRLGDTTFESGRDVLSPAGQAALAELIVRLKGKQQVHFEVVGHTDNQRIAPRLRPTFPTNQALSEARARVVVASLAAGLGLPADAFTAQGLGETTPIASNDTPEGMALNRRTEVRLSFVEQVQPPTPPPPAPVPTLVRVDNCAPAAKFGLPFSISVDGQPLDGDTAQTEADRQRCVDVALDRADIQVKYDPLNVAPALNIWAVPAAAERGQTVIWRTYANYAWWVKKAEIRVFARGQTTDAAPFAIVPVEIGGDARWTPSPAASQDLGYVLRVYDDKGRFDETSMKTLSLLDRADAHLPDRATRDDLSGYGESSLKIKNIAASGGAVTISGERVQPGETVTAMGVPVPVDTHGKFVFRQILPAGPHKVIVAVKEPDGRTASFERNLSIADKDWFYVAVADLTAGKGHTTGPAPIVTTDTDHYDKKATVDGRLAFYLKGKILGKYLLTASADTREQPIKHLFSNFDSKDPTYLLRRIDPNRYYPVYGDDSTIVDDAPSQGKFFVRLERDSAHIMWGDFQTSWTGTELTQYSRGLYGADLVWNSKATTQQGERRATLEAFAAEPGTLQSREEFRGTGGSLFYLRRQDVTQGSERLWAEVRDKDSGIVLSRTLLSPSQDYEINYLQGRITLTTPLPIVADSGGLVQTSSLNGDPVYLVATYEYVPGLARVRGSTLGARATFWATDHTRLGVSVYHQGDGGVKQDLEGLDVLLRYKPGTWIKAEAARSDGVGVAALSSISGGFDFTQNQSPNVAANAYRVDAAADLSELSGALRGRLTGYAQQRERGFSGPGLATAGGESLKQAGAAAVVPLGKRAEIAVKADELSSPSLRNNSEEVALRVKLSAEWGVSAGVRRDDHDNRPLSAGVIVDASPSLNRNGARTDAIIRFDFRPLASHQDPAAVTSGAPTETSAAPAYLTSGNVATFDSAGPAGSLVPAALSGTGGVVNIVTDPTASAGVAAAPLGGLSYKPWNLYGYAQQTLSRSGTRNSNDRGGVGGGWQVSSRLRLGAEASGGDGGWGGKLAADYSLDDRSNLYLTYARETDVPDQSYAGRQAVLTAGGRTRLSDQLSLFAESRQASGEGPHSLTHGFGVDYAPAQHWTTGVRLETGRVSDRFAGDLRRDAVSLNLGYRDGPLKLLTTIEYRDDKTTRLGSVAGTCDTSDLPTANPCVSAAGQTQRHTVLFKSSGQYQMDPAWRLLGVLNLSRSSSSEGAFYDGDYTEAVLGAAYRPVDNDRWNTLFKYTYFYNLPSSGQVGAFTNSRLDFTQRSHVLNVDTIYDLTKWLSVGAKYGLRIGELRDSRVGGPWFDSRAQLFVVRGDLHFVREWDGVLEFRRLSVTQAQDARAGVLAALYRHLGDNGKIGVGYNFTDFSDDLTNLDYRSRGFFINAIAEF